MARALRGAAGTLASAIYHTMMPVRCAFCERQCGIGRDLTEKVTAICAECAGRLPFIRANAFRAGGGPVIVPLRYTPMVRKAILQYKFGGRPYYRKAFSFLIASRALSETLRTGVGYDLVTWTPVHRRREAARGYDQAELLAAGVSGLLGVRKDRTLVRVRETAPQSKVGHRQREVNVEGAFAPAAGSRVAGLRVMLVDDVVTTGSTAEECMAILLMGGAKAVTLAAVATGKAGVELESVRGG
ncbi:MAG: hypothetical protein FWE70_08035 [Oscillospiraceae bacterium]|nr:hypothetical protein [Oscillospiraceae bacterium]